MHKFGNTLRNLRKASGLSGAAVARQLGVTRAMMSNWERHMAPPSERITQICDVLGCPEEEHRLQVLADMQRPQLLVELTELPAEVVRLFAELRHAAAGMTSNKARKLLQALQAQ